MVVATGMVRTYVLLPKDVVEEIDRRVGERRRSAFLTEAARRELRRARQLRALEKFAGALKDADIPGWETHDSTVEWVRAQRRPTGRDHWDGDNEGDR
jgi:hypothetical protein